VPELLARGLHCYDTPMVPKHQEFRFGEEAEFSFSRARGLWVSGKPLELRNLERQLLKVLLDRPNEMVRKEELRALVWPDVEVTDNALNVLVGRLRKLLGDADHTIVQTVSRIGYRIIATPELRRVAPVAKELRRRDGSRFVRDVTVPDGSIFEPGEPFAVRCNEGSSS
jgi:DNA-binding winged helix-turn-helix (wHTH) protein